MANWYDTYEDYESVGITDKYYIDAARLNSMVDRILEAQQMYNAMNSKDYDIHNDGTNASTNTTEINRIIANAAGEGIFFPSGTYLVDGNVDVDTGCTLYFAPGAKIHGDVGTEAITFSSNSSLIAGLWQVFSNIDVQFYRNSISQVIPQWFGADSTSTTSDDSSAIQSAVDSIGTYGGTVYFPTPGIYGIGSMIEIKSTEPINLVSQMARVHGTTSTDANAENKSMVIPVANLGTDPMIRYQSPLADRWKHGGGDIVNLTFQDISNIDASDAKNRPNYTMKAALDLIDFRQSKVKDCRFKHLNGSAIDVEDGVKSSLVGCDIAYCGREGYPAINLDGSGGYQPQSFVINDCKIEANFIEPYIYINEATKIKVNNCGFEALDSIGQRLTANLLAGNTTVSVNDSSRFSGSDEVCVQDDNGYYTTTVSSVPNTTTIELTGSDTNDYTTAADAKIKRSDKGDYGLTLQPFIYHTGHDDGIQISNSHFNEDGDVRLVLGQGCLVNNCYFDGRGDLESIIVDGHSCNITNSIFKDGSDTQPIRIFVGKNSLGHDATVAENQFRFGGAIKVDDASNCSVNNNTFWNNDVDDSKSYFPDATLEKTSSQKNIRINDNLFYYATGHRNCSAIKSEAVLTNVTNNQIFGAGTYGIYVTGNQSTIDGNNLRQLDNHNIYVTGANCVVINNILNTDAAGYDGIHMEAGAATSNFIVSNNLVVGTNNVSIYFDDDGSESYYESGVIIGNKVDSITYKNPVGAGRSNIVENIGYRLHNYYKISDMTDGNGEITFAHELTDTPDSVILTVEGDNTYNADVISVDATNITVRIKDSTDNTDVTSTAVVIYYNARSRG